MKSHTERINQLVNVLLQQPGAIVPSDLWAIVPVSNWTILFVSNGARVQLYHFICEQFYHCAIVQLFDCPVLLSKFIKKWLNCEMLQKNNCAIYFAKSLNDQNIIFRAIVRMFRQPINSKELHYRVPDSKALSSTNQWRAETMTDGRNQSSTDWHVR